MLQHTSAGRPDPNVRVSLEALRRTCSLCNAIRLSVLRCYHARGWHHLSARRDLLVAQEPVQSITKAQAWQDGRSIMSGHASAEPFVLPGLRWPEVLSRQSTILDSCINVRHGCSPRRSCSPGNCTRRLSVTGFVLQNVGKRSKAFISGFSCRSK